MPQRVRMAARMIVYVQPHRILDVRLVRPLERDRHQIRHRARRRAAKCNSRWKYNNKDAERASGPGATMHKCDVDAVLRP